MIPKIIHYCWFGGGPLPEEYENYIAEWQKLHPDWELKKWDETNTPLHDSYIQNAIRLGNWSNCSNYLRLWALQEFGGVYLDTDFKLIKPLDDLLVQPGFLGFEQPPSDDADFIVNNAIVGAVQNNSFISRCHQMLLHSFDGSEKSDLSGPGLTTKVLKSDWGLDTYGLQQLKDISIYPTAYFYPIHVHKAYLLNNYTEHIYPETYGIHMWGRSWVEKKDLLEIVDYLNFKRYDQDAYIKQLEANLAEQQKKADEVWFWKNHFEEQYNTLARQQQLTIEVDERLNEIYAAVNEIKDQQAAIAAERTQYENPMGDLKEALWNERQLIEKNIELNEQKCAIEKDYGLLKNNVTALSLESKKLKEQLEAFALENQTLLQQWNEKETAFEKEQAAQRHILELQLARFQESQQQLQKKVTEQASALLVWIKKEASWRVALGQKEDEVNRYKKQAETKDDREALLQKEVAEVRSQLNQLQTAHELLLKNHTGEDLKQFFKRKYLRKN